MGTTNPFASLFGKSPFKPLQRHMRTVTECAERIPELFTALNLGDQKQVAAIKEQIFALEHQADVIKDELRMRLPKSMFLPVDRRDLLEILDWQDAIADTAQDIAGLLIERPMEVPAGMGEPLIALTHRCLDACHKAAEIIEGLDELIEMGFTGRESERVLLVIAEVDRIEHETDEMGIALTRTLFAQEDEMKPLSVVLWYQLIHWVGDLADYAEKVSDRLRLLLAR